MAITTIPGLLGRADLHGTELWQQFQHVVTHRQHPAGAEGCHGPAGPINSYEDLERLRHAACGGLQASWSACLGESAPELSSSP